jgi:DNA-binding NtrC family response regulator
MPSEMLDTELFGRMVGQGSEIQPGRFQQAQGGTLYLSEISELPQLQQTALVRYVDEGTILPVGASKPIAVNARLMASTAESPEKLVQEGRLREDLFHRISAIRLHLPKLQERGEDLEFLLHHFLTHFAHRFKKEITTISAEALHIIREHSFPGNIRELKNIIEFAAMVCTDEEIRAEHIPGHLSRTLTQTPKHLASKQRKTLGKKS